MARSAAPSGSSPAGSLSGIAEAVPIAAALTLSGWVGAAAIALWRFAATAIRLGERAHAGAVVRQVFVSGVQALPLVCVVAAGSGAGIVLQTGIMAPPPSGELGRMLVVVVLRELTPLVTAIVVAGHSGAVLAAQQDLRAGPRVLGTVVSVLALTVYFGAVAIVVGYVTSQLLTLRSFEAVRDGFQQELRLLDLPLFVLKGAGLGAIVGACAGWGRHGASAASRLAPGPPAPALLAESSRAAFTASVLVCMAYSGLITVLFYALVGSPAPP